MILAPTTMQNNRGGNGRYTPLRRTSAPTAEMNDAQMQAAIDRLNALNDQRMRFKNSRDPIYVAFDYMQRQSVKSLAKEFVKDIINEGLSFISQYR